MVSCMKCGAENREDAVYCTNCGALLEKRRGGAAEPSEISRREPSQCFGSQPPRTGRREQSDYLGLLSAGVILIILALTYLRYPINLSLILSYLESLGARGGFVKPPLALLDPVIFFFYFVGAWTLVLSALRIVLQRDVKRAAGDVAGALFSFFFAFLLTNYANNVLRGQAVLAYLIVAIGLLVVVNAVVHFAYPERRWHAKD